nr:hypothetical protein [Tanacetum cinerariifolium]
MMQANEGALSVMGARPMDISSAYTPHHNVPPNSKQRTSSLMSPIMLLTGHQSAVYTMKFNPSGTVIASGSHDREIFLWHVKKMAEHSSFVNSCCPSRRGPPLVVSGSDDGTAKLWDLRQRGAIQTFPDKYQITAVAFSDTADKIYSGGIDNVVKVWDLRRNESAVYTMKFNPSGTVIASGSHDREIFLWHVSGECKNYMVLKGHKNAVLDLQWTSDGSQIISASPDKTLRAWDVETGKQVKKMAEHSSFVNS